MASLKGQYPLSFAGERAEKTMSYPSGNLSPRGRRASRIQRLTRLRSTALPTLRLTENPTLGRSRSFRLKTWMTASLFLAIVPWL